MENSDLRKIYPFSPPNPNLKEFYKQKEEENFAKKIRRKLTLKDYSLILAVIAGSLFIMISVLTLNYNRDLRSRAGENRINLSLYPKSVSLQNNDTVTVSPKITSLDNKKIIQAIITLEYDPTAVAVQKFYLAAISLADINFQSTSTEKANQEGKIKILLQAKSDEYAPTGIISLPQIIFEKLGSESTEVKINSSQSSVIFTDGSSPTIVTSSTTKIN